MGFESDRSDGAWVFTVRLSATQAELEGVSVTLGAPRSAVTTGNWPAGVVGNIDSDPAAKEFRIIIRSRAAQDAIPESEHLWLLVHLNCVAMLPEGEVPPGGRYLGTLFGPK